MILASTTFALAAHLVLPALVGAAPEAVGAAAFLARVEENDPRLEALEARVDRARAGAIEAGLLPNPSIAYERQETFASGQSFPENDLRLGVAIEIGGRRGPRREAAESGAEAARAEADRDRALALLDALELFYAAAHARMRVEVLAGSGAALERVSTSLRARKAAGEASGYDLGRIELEAAMESDLRASAEVDLARMRAALGILAGVPEGLDAADPLDIPSVATSSRAMEAILAARGDFRAAERRARQAELELSAARRSWVPALGISGGLKTIGMGAETAKGYVVAAELSLPLFDHGQADEARALALRREAEAMKRALERSVPAEIRAAELALARRVVQAARFSGEQRAAAEALVSRAESAYAEGEAPLLELLDAHRTAASVRLRTLELRHAAKTAELDLHRARGTRP